MSALNIKKVEQKVVTFAQPGKPKCFNCGKSDHRDRARYCVNCGTKLIHLKNYNHIRN